MAALLLSIGFLAGCGAFGVGLAELPAEQGWRPLPIADWVLNEGVAPRSIVYCPRDACARPGLAALLVASGPEADAIERGLADDPASLARRFGRPPVARDRAAPPKPASRTPRPVPSRTSVERLALGGASGVQVDIRSLGPDGRLASTVILYGRDGADLVLALGVSDDPQQSRTVALSAWRSR